MQNVTLQEVIRQNIRLPNRANGRGFFSVLCKVCNDHGRKGPRAGFKFDGDAVGYNCFNCGHTASFDPNENQTMPHKMVEVLRAFGVDDVDWSPVLFSALQNQEAGRSTQKEKFVSIEPANIPMLPFAVPLTDSDNEWNQFAIEYLRDKRGIDWKDYSFHIVNELSDHPDCKRWYGRLIIPIYKNNKVIFYQGRDLSDTRPKKYLNPSVDRSNVMYGYHQLFADTEDPLYVTEGWFDSFMIQGVAVFGNHMTPAQIKWLTQSRREKVIIPDKFGDGHLLAQQAIDLGWSVSYPDIGGCKDVNDAIVKYGKLYTLKTIRDNTCSDFAAEARLRIYCEVKPNDGKRTGSA